MLFLCYYYPFYPKKETEYWRKQNDNEWDLLHAARPLTQQHTIKKPIGYPGVQPYYDSTSIDVINGQINLASKYLIDGFVFNSYMDYERNFYLDKTINSFLEAKKPQTFYFALNWSYKLPRRTFPQLLNCDNDDAWRKVPIDANYFGDFIEHACKYYFRDPHYLKIDGAPVLYVYEINSIFRYFNYSFIQINEMLKRGIEVAKDHGYKGLFYVGLFSYFDNNHARDISQIHLSAATGYAFLPNFSKLPLLQKYSELVMERQEEQHEFSKLGIPWLPVVVAGWDSTSRGQQGLHISDFANYSWPPYPWFPLVVQTAPNEFKRWLEESIQYLKQHNETPKIINITSFNEWTEGNAIEPNDHDGFGFLEVIRCIKEKCTRGGI